MRNGSLPLASRLRACDPKPAICSCARLITPRARRPALQRELHTRREHPPEEQVQVNQVRQLVPRQQAEGGAAAPGARGTAGAVHKELGLGRKVCVRA